MAKRYSQDLRDRVIDAVEREDVSRRAAARRYEISESVAVKWLERQKRPSSRKTRIAVPRARLTGEDGKTREWRSGSLRACQRRTRAADALIAGAYLAGAYLAGTNPRRVRGALNAVFGGPVGKDVVSRVWRKPKGDWDAWNARSLAEEPIVRLILDGTVARVRLDRRATSISLLVARGAWRARRRSEDAARDQEHGRGRRGGLACAARRSGPARIANAGAGRHRRRTGPRKGGGGAVARHGCPTLHRAQASQSPRPRARAPARGNLERLPRHDLRRAARRGRDPAQGVLPQMAPQMPRRRRQPGGSRQQAVHIHPVPAEPMEIDPNLERDRAIARGVQAPDQHSDRAALRRNRRQAVLGAARLRTDHHAQGRRMADPRRETRRSDH